MSWTLRLGSELGRDLSRPPMPKPEPEATLARDICLLSTCAMGSRGRGQPGQSALSSLSRWVSHRTRCRGRRRELRVSGPTIGGRGSGGSEQAGVPADTSSPAHKFRELVPAWELSRMEEKVEGQISLGDWGGRPGPRKSLTSRASLQRSLLPNPVLDSNDKHQGQPAPRIPFSNF